MPRRKMSWWEEDVLDDIEDSVYDRRNSLVDDGGLAGWEAAWLEGYEDAGFDDAG